MVKSGHLGEFTDAFVDRIIERAAADDDPVITSLANCIRRRRPPRLLKEIHVLENNGRPAHAGSMFRQSCQHHLRSLASDHSLPLGRFLVCSTPPLTLEERGASDGGASQKSRARGTRGIDQSICERRARTCIRRQHSPQHFEHLFKSLFPVVPLVFRADRWRSAQPRQYAKGDGCVLVMVIKAP